MVPHRFTVDYPQRALVLLEMLEPQARQAKLVGSFALLVAAAVFLIPYERMKRSHPLREGQDDALTRALRDMDKVKFMTAPFWVGIEPGSWRYSRIVNDVSNTRQWADADGVYPMNDKATNSIASRKAEDVLRVIRNALAHGNVVYLNAEGHEVPNTEVRYLAFLSRYEEQKDRNSPETYRLIVTSENSFLCFVKAWAHWIAQFDRNTDLVEAA